MRTLALALLLVVAGVFPAAGQSAKRTAGPVIEIDPDEHDFGSARQDQELVHDFIVTNTGTEDLVLSKIVTACGCTAAVAAETPPAESNENLACLAVTLAVEWYRHDSVDAAISYLEGFADPDSGGDSYAWFYLAMALERHGDHQQAMQRHRQAVDWMKQHKPGNAELHELQGESASVLGLPADVVSPSSTTADLQP